MLFLLGRYLFCGARTPPSVATEGNSSSCFSSVLAEELGQGGGMFFSDEEVLFGGTLEIKLCLLLSRVLEVE